MSVLIMHARWNSLSTQQRSSLDELVAQERSAEGCCSLTSRLDGTSVLLTAVWQDEGSMLAFTLGPLARARTAAALDEPQVALFAVPDLFAVAYRRPAAVQVPAPRETSVPVELDRRTASAGLV